MKRICFMCAAAFVLIPLLLTACQPTPDQEVIISQNGALAPKVILDMEPDFDLPAMLAKVPKRWATEMILRDGTVKIAIDAGIEYPNVSAIPIVEVVPTSFEPEKIEALVRAIGGKDAYMAILPQDASGRVLPSREDYEAWIADITGTIKKLTAENAESCSEETAAYIADLESERKRLTEELAAYQEVPAEIVKDYSTLQSTFQVEGYIYDSEGNKAAQVQIGLRGRAQDDVRESFIYVTKISAPVSDGDIGSLEDAVAAGERLLEDLGVSGGYDLVSIAGNDEAYELSYGRTYKGIAYSPSVNKRIVYESECSPAWVDERLSVGFDVGKSIPRFFHWWGYGSMEEERSTNAALCDFSEIQAASETQLSSIFSWRADEIATTDIMIDRISLGYMRVKMQNAADGYMLIPAWTFQGRIINTYREGYGYTPNHPVQEMLEDNAVLVLSAIDGAVIYSGTANH